MIGVIWAIVSSVILGFYNGLLILDDQTDMSDPKNNAIKVKWHFVGAALFIHLSITAWYFWGIEYIPFVLSCFWLLFAGIVHVIGLNKSFFFVGSTSKTDILLRKIFKKSPIMGSAFLKITTMILSLIVLFLVKKYK